MWTSIYAKTERNGQGQKDKWQAKKKKKALQALSNNYSGKKRKKKVRNAYNFSGSF